MVLGLVSYPQLSNDIYLPVVGTNMYHALINRQIIKLFNDITQIKMGKRILLKISREFEEKKSYILWPAMYSSYLKDFM